MPCLSRTRPSTVGIWPRTPRPPAWARREAGHDVGHIAHAVAIDFAAQRLAVGLVGQRQHGVGVGVVDELVRQEGVQQGLDRRVGRGRSRADWRAAGATMSSSDSLSRPAQFRSGASRTRRQAGAARSSPGPSREPLTQSTSTSSPMRSVSACLDRGVAAAMQHQARIAAEQAAWCRRAARGSSADALGGVAGDRRPRLASVQPLCIGFFLSYSAAAAVRSGKAAASRRPMPAQTPRSVIRPVTSRAGVTSKA